MYDTLLKPKDTRSAAPACWNVQGRDCGRAILSIVWWSGWDTGMPRTVAKMRKHMLDSDRWQNRGLWNGKESSLQPGDILIRVKGIDGAKGNHVCMYVGNAIAQAVYDDFLKGTDADKGAPKTDATFVSAHLAGGNPPNKGYAPCIGNKSYAGADTKMRVFRCVKPEHSKKYANVK